MTLVVELYDCHDSHCTACSYDNPSYTSGLASGSLSCTACAAGWLLVPIPADSNPAHKMCTECGNGVIDTGEDCDPGSSTVTGCSSCAYGTATVYVDSGSGAVSSTKTYVCDNNGPTNSGGSNDATHPETT